MLPMPLVQGKELVEPMDARLGMTKRSREVVVRHRPEQRHPALVKALEEHELEVLEYERQALA
jgi:hypothetical protein